MKLKIFVDSSHYVPEKRKYLHSIPKAFWNEKSDAERRRSYGNINDLFVLVNTIEEADICLMTMKWNYYLDFHKEKLAFEFAERAQRARKFIVVWSEGDFGVRLPKENAILFQHTIQRSKRKLHEYALPPVFGDNVDIYLGGQPRFRKKGPKPIIGFCGQAASSNYRLQTWRLNNLSHHLRYSLGFNKYLPPPFQPPSVLRSKVLDYFQQSSAVQTNFILREQYWGGVDSSLDRNAPYHPIKKEYIDNLDNNDYIVSVRGAGNWSKRFYEALNWGRIPIFVDTDCVLPYDFAVNWKEYCIWVDQTDIPFIAEIVAEFHAGLSDQDFVDLQYRCRELWKDRLSANGFYSHFHEHFVDLLALNV